MDDILEFLLKPGTIERSCLVRECLKKLLDIFQNELNELEAIIYTAKALDTVNGIPRYVVIASQPVFKDTDQPIKVAIELIQLIIVRLPSASELSVSKLIDWSIRFIDQNVGNDLKSSVMKLVYTIVENCDCINVDWDVVLTKLGEYLKRESNIPPSFRDSLYLAIGKIFAIHPDHAAKCEKWFFVQLAQSFEQHRTGKDIPDVLIEACFNGLNGILVHFSPSNKETRKIFYSNLKKYSELRSGMRERNTVTRSALRVFTAHGKNFSDEIYGDYKEWHETLTRWITYYQPTEHKQMGANALATFYKVMSESLLKRDPATEISSYFFNIFGNFLRQKNIYFVRSALFGIAAMAENYVQMLSKTIVRNTLKSVNEIDNNALIGARFEALSQLYLALRDFSQMEKLTGLAVNLIMDYPNIEKAFQKQCLDALENCLCVWIERKTDDTNAVIYQSLLQCCACPLVVEIQTEDEPTILLKNYLPVWNRLLTINQRAINPKQAKAGKKIFKTFIDCFLKILNKIDLRLKKISNDFLNPAQTYEPESSNDFLIFINLVELFEQVACTPDLLIFNNSIFNVCIKLSRENPFVSGFYKIISVCLSLDETIDDVDSFVRFLSENIDRLDSLTDDDLLIANLKLIFSCPVYVMKNFVTELRLIVNTAIRTAHGFPVLYDWIITALEKWHDDLDLNAVLLEALPQLSTTLLNPAQRITAQKRFLMFMAKLEPDVRYVENIHENMSIDDSPLIYKLCLPDIRAMLTLNRLIPRAVDLAVFSADRDTRVIAAEFLHAVVLLAIARNRETSNGADLLKTLLSTCMTLSCDTDLFFKRLFRQLIYQVVHYFAKRTKESKIILDVLFDAVTHPIDSGLRQFSSDCLNEFATWADREHNLEAVEKLLNLIMDLTWHPDRVKRLGGVVAFNRVSTVVDRSILQKMANGFLSNFFNFLDNDADLIETAIYHILEIFKFSNDLAEIQKTVFQFCSNANERVRHVAIKFLLYLNDESDLLNQIIPNALKQSVPDSKEKLEIFIVYFAKFNHFTEEMVLDLVEIFKKLDVDLQQDFIKIINQLENFPNFLEIFKNQLPDFNEENLLIHLDDEKFLNMFLIAINYLNVEENYSGDLIIGEIFKKCCEEKITPKLLKQLEKIIDFAAEHDMTVRMIIELLTNTEEMENQKTKGEFFNKAFNKKLSDFLANSPETVGILAKMKSGIERISQILLISNPDILISWNLKNWNLWTNNRTNKELLDFLKTMQQVGYDCFKQNVKFKIYKWFNKLIKNPKPETEELSTFFQLFPDLFNDLFPLDILEKNWLKFGKGDAPKTSLAIFESILLACEQTGNEKLLEYFLKSAALNESILPLPRIQQCVKNVAEKFDCLKIAQIIFNLIFTEFSEKSVIFLLTDVLASLLRFKFNIDFYNNFIKDFLKILESKLSERFQRDLARKMAAIEMIIILYEKTTQDERITMQKFLKHSTLFKKIISACKVGRFKCQAIELLRAYDCRCVKFMCTFSKQLTEPRHLDLFLLQTDIWPMIVDNSNKLSLPLFPITEKRKFADKRANRKTEGYANSLASSLFESTLREDVRHYDLSHVTITEPICESVEVNNDELFNQSEILQDFCKSLKEIYAKGFVKNVNIFLENSLASGSYNEQCFKLKIICNCNLETDQKTNDAILTTILSLLTTSGINYLITNVFKMLINQQAKFSNPSILLKTIELMIIKPNTYREEELRQIFQTLKLIFEMWRQFLNLNETTQMMLNRINNFSNNSANFVNLELASVLLANNLFDLNETVKLAVWLRGVLICDKKHSNMASEVYGLLASKSTNIELQYLNKDVATLKGVHKFYPNVSSHFVEFLMQRAWQERTILKQYALEMLLTHMERNNGFGANDELQTAFVPFASDILKSASRSAQAIILKMIAIIGIPEKLLPDVIKLTKDSSDELRKLSCNVLMKTFNKNCKFPLLQRINDVNLEIGVEILNFFSKRCPKGSKNRLNFILTEMYSPETELDFLQYATKFLIEPSFNTPDYTSPIFDHPLADCTFTKMHLAQSFVSTLMPMFAPTASFQSSHTDEDVGLILHRAYRSGDYPDIQIKNSEFIQLVLALMAKDKQFCKILFIIVLSAIADDNEEFSENFKIFFDKSLGEDLTCVAGFMEIALQRKINLPVEKISRLSRTTGLLSMGALLIETAMETPKSNSPKRIKTDTPWLQLADIYYDLKDTQAVRGILLNNLSVNEEAKAAIFHEISMDYVSAASFYEKAFNKEIIPDYLNFYNQSYLTCLTNLSDWNQILNCLNQTCPNDDKLWTDSWCSDVLLPLKFRSEMLVNSENFIKYVDKNIDKKLLKFSEEVSVAFLLKSDIPKAIAYINNAMGNFVNQWANSNIWDCELRKNYLKNLQIVAEIYEMVDCMAAKSSNDEITKMCNQTPCLKSDLTVWDVRLRLRKYFANLINDETYSQKLTKSFLKFAEVAVHQENFTLSRRYFLLMRGRDLNQEEMEKQKMIRNLCSIVEIKKSKSENRVKDYWEIYKKSEEKFIQLKILTEMIKESERLNCFDWEFLQQINLKEIWKNTFENSIDKVKDVGQAFLQYAKILNNHVDFSSIAVAILKSMRYGCTEARELFALILTTDQIINEQVMQEMRLVPTWMFLMWKNQLISYLPKNSPIVLEIVERITKDYPAALRYRNPKNLDAKFIEQLSELTNPFLKIKFYVDQIKFTLDEKLPDWNIIKNGLDSMKQIFYAPETDNNRFVKKLLNEFKILENNRNFKRFKEALINFKIKLESTDSIKSFNHLKNFSPWLAEYRSICFANDERLEIPTSVFDGFTEPRERERVFVAYFKPNVLVLNSIRSPIKLTMIGTDAKEYNFLVKFGEDLRQDERIQQILSQMKRTLGNDSNLVTYRVEPLTEVLGLIQWVSSCKTLSELMVIDKNVVDRVAKEHVSFLSNNKPMSLLNSYLNGFLNKTITQAVYAFEQRVANFPSDALRTGIWRLTQTPEEFFGFRKNFGQSLAVLNVAHWIIGVGDRHLDNILVSIKTGRVVGIDFGLAFGFATQCLPLPELVPFRLTPQILGVLSPLRENGWLKLSMIDALDAIRADPHVLLAMLNVFVMEPCLDWIQNAKRLARLDGTFIQSNSYQSAKIQIVRDKLNGIHPVECFEMDLKTGRVGDECLDKQLAILNGINCIRTMLKNKGPLSAEEQVRCLIDLATDPAILCFTYVGWCPWL